MEIQNKFVILGIHGKEVPTVVGDFARIRMYVGGKEFDEDFALPKLPSAVDRTTENYAFFLEDAINHRMTELEALNV